MSSLMTYSARPTSSVDSMSNPLMIQANYMTSPRQSPKLNNIKQYVEWVLILQPCVYLNPLENKDSIQPQGIVRDQVCLWAMVVLMLLSLQFLTNIRERCLARQQVSVQIKQANKSIDQPSLLENNISEERKLLVIYALVKYCQLTWLECMVSTMGRKVSYVQLIK